MDFTISNSTRNHIFRVLRKVGISTREGYERGCLMIRVRALPSEVSKALVKAYGYPVPFRNIHAIPYEEVYVWFGPTENPNHTIVYVTRRAN